MLRSGERTTRLPAGTSDGPGFRRIVHLERAYEALEPLPATRRGCYLFVTSLEAVHRLKSRGRGVRGHKAHRCSSTVEHGRIERRENGWWRTCRAGRTRRERRELRHGRHAWHGGRPSSQPSSTSRGCSWTFLAEGPSRRVGAATPARPFVSAYYYSPDAVGRAGSEMFQPHAARRQGGPRNPAQPRASANADRDHSLAVLELLVEEGAASLVRRGLDLELPHLGLMRARVVGRDGLDVRAQDHDRSVDRAGDGYGRSRVSGTVTPAASRVSSPRAAAAAGARIPPGGRRRDGRGSTSPGRAWGA